MTMGDEVKQTLKPLYQGTLRTAKLAGSQGQREPMWL